MARRARDFPGDLQAACVRVRLVLVRGGRPQRSFIPGGLDAILFIIRTALEDKTLQAELDGYAAYTDRVRYRLLPGVW